jgi:hypothetical protein
MADKDPEGYSTQVTYMGMANGWGVRVLHNGKVIDEVLVSSKDLIGPAIASMLRMIDKCGNPSSMASASRDRQWYKLTQKGKP